jgi:oligopeptide transport system ATP-binding protein
MSARGEANSPILSVRNLRTAFETSDGLVEAVRGVSFDLRHKEVLGIVGESGSGKTVTSMSILRLLPPNGFIAGGEIIFDGADITKMRARSLRRVRGDRIAMVFQDPMTSLNPLMPIGGQIAEMIGEHRRGMSASAVKAEVLRLLKLVSIPEPDARYYSYPHEFSGGMRQRVTIAMAIACEPDVLIADEPTTALDVTIQEQILILLEDLRDRLDMSVMFITHDLGVVAELCTRVIVMYGGMIMEEGPVAGIFERPMHPYTAGLLASVPNLASDKGQKLSSIPGSPPDMTHPPAGCPYSPRCGHARNLCGAYVPPMFDAGGERRSSCWLLAPDAPFGDNPFKTGGRDG